NSNKSASYRWSDMPLTCCPQIRNPKRFRSSPLAFGRLAFCKRFKTLARLRSPTATKFWAATRDERQATLYSSNACSRMSLIFHLGMKVAVQNSGAPSLRDVVHTKQAIFQQLNV